MNKELEQYNKLRNKTLTTSEVIQKSFTNVFEKLEKEDFVLVENQRKKVTMVVQTIDKYVGVDTSSKSFDNKKVESSFENRLLARTFIKENTYYLMKFESPNITFPVIDKAYMATNADKLEDFDEIITRQLIEGWRYVISTPEAFSYDVFLKLHGVIAKNQALSWGALRTGEVGVGGTEYKPEVPSKESIGKIMKLEGKDIYEASMRRMVRLIKAQPFWDGNKRTAFLITNKFFIDNALGLVVVNTDNFDKFNELLNNYYNDQSSEDILVKFLKDNCIYNSSTKKLIQ